MSGGALFRSAILAGGPDGGALPRRRFRRPLLFSAAAHLALLAWIVTLTMADLGPVPPPPLTVRFYASPPPAPRLVPLRERQEPPAPAPRPREAVVPPLAAFQPRPDRLERPRPEPIPVESEPLPIQVPDSAPRIAIVDAAPAAQIAGASRVAPLGAPTSPQEGTEEPDLTFLVPGEARARGAGGGIVGRDLIPIPPTGDPSGPRPGGGAGDPGIAREKAFIATGLASYLSRRYGVNLMEASRLGSRSTDGARYALLLPALSEAYRAVPFRGHRRGGAGEAVESVQVDADAIAIRYRDGTLHVLAPTGDGLVALFVSSRAGAQGGSKVQEAERALGALQRFSRDGSGGRQG